MAHKLAFDTLSGEYNCFVVGSAWHNLNQTAEKPVTWEQARNLAHLNFTVSKRKLVHPNHPEQSIDAWGIFRDDNEVFLATVGGAYVPMQFEYAFSFVDSLMGEAGGSHYESAGAIGKGEKFWVLARVPAADFYITGTEDENKGFVLFSSSHDGSMATTSRLTSVRVVCNNTLQSALRRGGTGTVLKIKHTTNAEKRLEAAKALMNEVVLSSQDLEAKLNILASRSMTRDTFISSLDKTFPGEDSPQRNKVMLRIAELFESNDGNAVPKIRGSAYSLLNSVTNYVDHEKGVRLTKGRKGISEDMARAENAIFGIGDEVKSRALDVILSETQDNPVRSLETSYLDLGQNKLVNEIVSGVTTEYDSVN